MIKPDTKISETELSKRIVNILYSNQIFTIEELIKKELSFLMRIEGIGKNSIMEIVLFTHKNGYFFKD